MAELSSFGRHNGSFNSWTCPLLSQVAFCRPVCKYQSRAISFILCPFVFRLPQRFIIFTKGIAWCLWVRSAWLSGFSCLLVSLGLFAFFLLSLTLLRREVNLYLYYSSFNFFLIEFDVSLLTVLAFLRDSMSFTVYCQLVVYHCWSRLHRRYSVCVRVVG
jgi:hypothetical protein